MKVKQNRVWCLGKGLALFLLVCLLLSACTRGRALKRVEKSGKITVVTFNSPHCYYVYRDERMGFEYDLAKAFARFLHVDLKVRVCESWDELVHLLYSEAADFAAASLSITPSRSETVAFSQGYLPVQQMLITHKNNAGIKNLADLEGKTIYVPERTSYEEGLRKLRQNGLDITIRALKDVTTDELIEAVAKGKIGFTVADSNVALLNRRYYPDLRILFAVGKSQALGWAVKKGETPLLDKINQFFDAIKENGTFDEIYNRYYAYLERFNRFDIRKFHERIQVLLPKYKKRIEEAAEAYGLDWRLITALVYQESQFDPMAKSFSGVRGLMQLTLPTAKELGVENRLDPDESIMAGVRYLRRLYDMYGAADEPDRLCIALAAYNVGKGHIEDARRIASEMELDPNKWSSLEKTLPLLRQRKYYKKSKYGYCRGTEAVFHVRQILAYYEILKRQGMEYAERDFEEQ